MTAIDRRVKHLEDTMAQAKAFEGDGEPTFDENGEIESVTFIGTDSLMIRTKIEDLV